MGFMDWCFWKNKGSQKKKQAYPAENRVENSTELCGICLFWGRNPKSGVTQPLMYVFMSIISKRYCAAPSLFPHCQRQSFCLWYRLAGDPAYEKALAESLTC